MSVLEDFVIWVHARVVLSWLLGRALLEVDALTVSVGDRIIICLAAFVRFDRQSLPASEVVVVWVEESHKAETVKVNDNVIAEVVHENFFLRIVFSWIRLIEVPCELQEVAQLVKDEYDEQGSLLSPEHRVQQSLLFRSDLINEHNINSGQEEEHE